MINYPQFALETRNRLRNFQASRNSSDWRVDKTIPEIVLEITWRVAEKIGGEKLPR